MWTELRPTLYVVSRLPYSDMAIVHSPLLKNIQTTLKLSNTFYYLNSFVEYLIKCWNVKRHMCHTGVRIESYDVEMGNEHNNCLYIVFESMTIGPPTVCPTTFRPRHLDRFCNGDNWPRFIFKKYYFLLCVYS